LPPRLAGLFSALVGGASGIRLDGSAFRPMKRSRVRHQIGLTTPGQQCRPVGAGSRTAHHILLLAPRLANGRWCPVSHWRALADCVVSMKTKRFMQWKSDAQLWIEWSSPHSAKQRQRSPWIPAETTPVAAVPLRTGVKPRSGPRTCAACKSRPQGTPGWYEYSGYCSACQYETLDMNQRMPADYGGAWKRQLQRCKQELEAGIEALRSLGLVAGPVTLGGRLIPSPAPQDNEAVDVAA
jgi:hypothetical protein